MTAKERMEAESKHADAGWGESYSFFPKLIQQYKFKIGVEVGVAFAGHAYAILTNTNLSKLYGVDPFVHIDGYPMDFSQEEYDEMYNIVKKRMDPYGDRYVHIRKWSTEAVNDIPGEIDFVYIDANHSYEKVWEDLVNWFPKIRIGGIIGGHDYNHPNFPGVKQAVYEFFRRFNWQIHEEGLYVWWVEKKPLHVSFYIPIYNGADTINETVDSIMQGNFEDSDELIIVNDGSTDDTAAVLNQLKEKYSQIVVLNHIINKSSPVARNTGIEFAKNLIVFNLDADNLLERGSISKLKIFLINSGADVAAFDTLAYFEKNRNNITHKWVFPAGNFSLADYLSEPRSPGATGNYMFTKEAWLRAGRYPEFAGALDSWCFGLRLLATGSKMMVLKDTFYYHRIHPNSDWLRFVNKYGAEKLSTVALQNMIPFLDLLDESDVNYILDKEGRKKWFSLLSEHPIRVKNAIPNKFIKKSIVKTMKKLPLAERIKNLQKNMRNLIGSLKAVIMEFLKS